MTDTWTDPATWSAGTVTSGMMNTRIRDMFRAFSIPTSYTPVFGAVTAAPSLGNGTIAGSYFRAGSLVVAKIELTWGSTTTEGTGAWKFTLPFAALDYSEIIGTAVVVDSVSGPSSFWDVVAGPPAIGLSNCALYNRTTMNPADSASMILSTDWKLIINVTYEADI